MAERTRGPVKPPVLDLTARDATPPSESKPETTPAPAAPEEPIEPPKPVEAVEPEPAPVPPEPVQDPIPETKIKPEPEPLTTSSKPAPAPETPSPTRSTANLSGPMGFAIGGGAILGAGLAALLAATGLFPMPQPRDNSAAIAELSARVESLAETASANLAAAEGKTAALDTELSGRIDAVREELTASAGAAQPVDLAPIEAEVKTLSDKLDAVAAGASSGDAAALTETVGTLRTELTALVARLDSIEAGSGTISDTVQTLTADLAATQTSLADLGSAAANSASGIAIQMPLILSGLENAFDFGRPFAEELASLRAAAPDIAIPDSLAAAANTGLLRPDQLAETFQANLPAIIAATPANPDADWQQASVDWFKTLLAARPADEVAGATPEAVLSQLEAAMARRDYAAATTLLARLPEPMQAAAANVASAISAHADAASFITTLRSKALADSTGGAS